MEKSATKSVGIGGRFSSLLFAFAQLWMLLVLLMVVVRDMMSPASAQQTDFVGSFYVAGTMLAKGLLQHVYSTNGQTFIGSYFDTYTHLLLPQAPAAMLGVFAYSPLVALFFSPFAFLPPHLALLCWQLIIILSVAGCAALAKKVSSLQPLKLVVVSFAYLPVCATLWIGQLGIVFGLLPLLIGYVLMCQKKPFFAGLAWSSTLLKPQLIPVALLASVGLFIAGQRRCFFGLITGCTAFMCLLLVFFGWDTVSAWLRVLTLYGHILSGPDVIAPQHLIVGLPGAILAALPRDMRASFKMVEYVVAAVLASLTLASILIAAKQHIPLEEKIPVILTLSVLALPLYSPHLLLYDLSLFVLPAILIYGSTADKTLACLRSTATAVWVCLNVYVGVSLTFTHLVPPLVLPLLILVLNFVVWGVLWSKRAQPSELRE